MELLVYSPRDRFLFEVSIMISGSPSSWPRWSSGSEVNTCTKRAPMAYTVKSIKPSFVTYLYLNLQGILKTGRRPWTATEKRTEMLIATLRLVGCPFSPALHTVGAREIWIDQLGFSRWEKSRCPHVNVSWQERHWNQATFPIGDCNKYSLKGIYSSQNHFTLQKEKIWNILCLQASNLTQNSSSSSVAM